MFVATGVIGMTMSIGARGEPVGARSLDEAEFRNRAGLVGLPVRWACLRVCPVTKRPDVS